MKDFRKILSIVFSLLSILVFLSNNSRENPSQPKVVTSSVSITKVIDGDTVWVNKDGVEEKIRLLGIDTPELNTSDLTERCFAIEAKESLENLLLDREVKLESESETFQKDKYGRTLAYLSSNGENLNLKLLQQGDAKIYKYYKGKHLKEFQSAEQLAKESQIGIWSNKCEL